MSSVVDLDALESAARASAGGDWVVGSPHSDNPNVCDVLTEVDGAELLESVPLADAAFCVAAQPKVVLALIARIRELEVALRGAARKLQDEATYSLLPEQGRRMNDSATVALAVAANPVST